MSSIMNFGMSMIKGFKKLVMRSKVFVRRSRKVRINGRLYSRVLAENCNMNYLSGSDFASGLGPAHEADS